MNPEKPSISPEKKDNNHEIQQVAAEQEQRIGERLNERAAEQSPDNAERARSDALEQAAERERQVAVAPEKSPDTERQSPATRRVGKVERDASFKTTMSEVQGQMSAPSRAFSKVIHNKAVEEASEVAGSTIARPNALLSGAIFAFILTLAVYLVAKNIGYPLSGFESIGAFIVGWVVGILYDFLKVMITGRK